MPNSEDFNSFEIDEALAEACELSYRRGYMAAVSYLEPGSDYYRKTLEWRYAEPMKFLEPTHYD